MPTIRWGDSMGGQIRGGPIILRATILAAKRAQLSCDRHGDRSRCGDRMRRLLDHLPSAPRRKAAKKKGRRGGALKFARRPEALANPLAANGEIHAVALGLGIDIQDRVQRREFWGWMPRPPRQQPRPLSRAWRQGGPDSMNRMTTNAFAVLRARRTVTSVLQTQESCQAARDHFSPDSRRPASGPGVTTALA